MGVARVGASHLVAVDPGPAAAPGRVEAAAGRDDAREAPISLLAAARDAIRRIRRLLHGRHVLVWHDRLLSPGVEDLRLAVRLVVQAKVRLGVGSKVKIE